MNLGHLSLRARLIGLIGVLIATALAAGIAVVVLSAGPRIRAEEESATRLAREMTENAFAGVRNATEANAALARLTGDLRNLRHIDLFVDGVGAPQQHNGRRAPEWFEKLVDARPSATRVPSPYIGAARDIVIATNPQDEVVEIWDDVRTLALGGAALALAAFALTAFLVDQALRPIGALSAGLARLENGDYTPPPRGVESGDFAEMTQRLSALATRLRDLSSENRRLTQAMVRVQDEERAAIARDLHDEFGPSLFAMRAGLSALSRRAKEGPVPPDVVTQATRGIGEQAQALQQINRRVLANLKPATLAEFGLAAALQELCEQSRQSAPQLDIALAIPPDLEPLDETIALTVYRIAQEGLTNVLRHASASRARIDVAAVKQGAARRISVRVSDDGAGLSQDVREGFGLAGMRQRVAALGGVLEIAEARSGGVEIHAELPVQLH
ncbi:MAG: sensor histidine kinase [Hyphomicrobiales bacterium]|nr:sensor histidine kinase [Hyphomicrobiales bacterium]